MKWALSFIFFVGLFSVSPEANLGQCDCAPNLTLRMHFERADAVFAGRVVGVITIAQPNAIEVEFSVQKVWKGELGKLATIKELFGTTAGFEKDAEWLVYASRDAQGTLVITRGCCSRTKPLSVAVKQGDMKAFKKMGVKSKE